jgi:hypothetical protein
MSSHSSAYLHVCLVKRSEFPTHFAITYSYPTQDIQLDTEFIKQFGNLCELIVMADSALAI